MAVDHSQVEIAVIGGGLAGLISAIALRKAGFDVLVIEKKSYPFHRVCGEYVSNEALPYLKHLGIDPGILGPSSITEVRVSAPNGKLLSAKLDLGGFGISRYSFDNYLYKIALKSGVRFLLNSKAQQICFSENTFQIELENNKSVVADLVIASYGKRSNLDQKLQRSFFYRRSPYCGVKYHIKTDFDQHVTQLDNFKGGYCGINKIEGELYNLCYLTENASLRKYRSIAEFEENVLLKNPFLNHRFKNSEFLFQKPLVINEISFESKTVVENHILFCGDAAGMITPLCGNGMAMAIHGAKILSEIIIANKNFRNYDVRNNLEQQYTLLWNKIFAPRLKTGRKIQTLFGNNLVSTAAVTVLNTSPSLTSFLIKKTHGDAF